jgi:hypothetical protein
VKVVVSPLTMQLAPRYSSSSSGTGVESACS